MRVFVEMLTNHNEYVYANQMQVLLDSHRNYIENRNKFGDVVSPVISMTHALDSLNFLSNVMLARKSDG
jgi:hypothetical protein